MNLNSIRSTKIDLPCCFYAICVHQVNEILISYHSNNSYLPAGVLLKKQYKNNDHAKKIMHLVLKFES